MVALLVALGCGPVLGDPNQVDVILISIDSLRRDHVSSYGNTRETTPFIDSLAAKGLRFENARSASPWTLPAHTTMLSGQWPSTHGAVEDDRQVDPSLPLIQRSLQAQGWATAGFVSTIFVSSLYGFNQGFSHFEDYHISQKENLAHSVRMSQVVDDALAWKETQGQKPIFLFLHTYDAHYPYVPPEGYETRFDRKASAKELAYHTYAYFLKNPVSEARFRVLRKQYDECILSIDDQIKRLYSSWKRPAVWIITADHGEEFGERGSWGHAHTLYPEVLDIPLVIAGPSIPVGLRGDRVGHIDLAPTIAGFAGLPWGGPGVDLRSAAPDRVMLAETSRFETSKLSVEADHWRLEVDRSASQSLLFDRQADPKELQAVALSGDGAVKAAELEQTLLKNLGTPCTSPVGTLESSGWLWSETGWVGQLQGPAHFGVYPPDATFLIDGEKKSLNCYPGSRSHDIDTTVRSQLESLGYVQENSP